MFFNNTFEVVEIRGKVQVKTIMRGSKKAIKKDIENIKANAKNYQMVGKNGMIVWA